ncbi:MAG: YhfC family glutamic-type intramembrane protease [Candidatus Promineifilaceae bacterium]
MFYALYTLNALLMFVPPIVLGIIIARKRGIGWGVFWSGALTFILSQVGHIPFNSIALPSLNTMFSGYSNNTALVGLALFLGVSSGVFEEVARYLTYRFWRKDVRTWGGGMMLGAGHGGVEAFLVGISFASTFLALTAYDAGMLPNLLASVPAEELSVAQALVQSQIQAFHAIPWYGRFLGGIERLFAITLHLSLSLMVMQCFTQKKHAWLVLAIAWHALSNAGAVIIIGLETQLIPGLENQYTAELFIGIIAIISLFIIFHFKQPEPVEPEPEPLPPLKKAELIEVDPTAENLEGSRYV